jgi:nucleoid DNA-binding protein
MVTQSELVTDLADRTGWSKGDVKNFFSNLEECLIENLEAGNRVKIVGVQIEPKVRPKSKARMGRNPATGEAVKIAAKPASVKLKARVLKSLVDKVDLPSPQKLARR